MAKKKSKMDRIKEELKRKYIEFFSLEELKDLITEYGLNNTISPNPLLYDCSCCVTVEDAEKMLKECIKENPAVFLRSLLNLKMEQVDVKYHITGEYYDKHTYEGYCFGTTSINGYSQIIDISEIKHNKSYLDNLDQDDITREACIEPKILSQSLFDKTITYYCKYYCENVADVDVFDEAIHEMSVDVYGIRLEDNQSELVVDILESGINYISGNIKMAFLNLFTAIDFYIEGLYDIVFREYVEKYKKKSEFGEEIIQKIRKYANQNRRLVDEKLKDSWKELNCESAIFNESKKKINDLEKKRNSIAHGEAAEVSEDNYVDLMISFMNIVSLFNGYESIGDVLMS